MVLAAILVIVALLLVNALYVAAEFAAVSVRRSRLHQLKEDGNPFAAWLLPIIESPAALDRYIAACQIGITISSLVLGAYAQATIAVWLAPYFAAVGGLQQVVARVNVDGRGAARSDDGPGRLRGAGAEADCPSVPDADVALHPHSDDGLALGLSPVHHVAERIGILILRMVGAPYQTHRHIHSPDEIELLIAESRDGGLLEPDEHRRLQRALRLNLRQARQLMVPRKRISALAIDTPLNEVVSIVAQSPYSRLPVYRGTIDNIVGILRTKDLVRWFVEGRPGATLADLMRQIPSVHESVSADRILKDLRERRSHQALVVDEAGGTAGLLTLADVLTELFGHVGDEFRPALPAIETLDDGRIRLPGEMGVDDAATLLETTWKTDASTVGGLVTEALGHIPAGGETVVVGDFEFEVERVRDRIPQSVAARRVVPVPSEDAQ